MLRKWMNIYHEQTGVSFRSVALELEMQEQNYGAWLKGGRGLPYEKVEKLINLLTLAGYIKFKG